MIQLSCSIQKQPGWPMKKDEIDRKKKPLDMSLYLTRV